MKNNIDIIKEKLNEINKFKREVNIMEVCGTHTMAIGRYGFRNLINENINLVSGPGCPVCVTPNMYIDYIYDLSLSEEIIIATYGDMIRVPGSIPEFSLEKAKAKGAQVKIVYSSIDALKIAQQNLDKKVVFLGIGFETTTPATAIAVKEAEKRGLDNFYILSMHKLVEPVMRSLLRDKSIKIEGFICPGHVAAIIGVKGFEFLNEYKCPGVITGFEALEIVNGIYEIIDSIKADEYGVKNAYTKLIKNQGNLVGKNLIYEVFDVVDDYWRGLDKIEKSGLKLKEKYWRFDIEKLFPLGDIYFKDKKNGCHCGDVLKGKIRPHQCKLFGNVCTPENPVGPCMVSSEGSCAAWFKYNL
jgi:hydrogenase expression/formation protein HypD